MAGLRVLLQPPRKAPAGQATRERHGLRVQLQRGALVAGPGEQASVVCVCMRVCVCRPISYFIIHIQTTHPKAHRATCMLARGPMNAENLVGP